MERKLKLFCPIVGCNTIHYSEEDIVRHYQDKHPEIEVINLGGKKINLKEV